MMCNPVFQARWALKNHIELEIELWQAFWAHAKELQLDENTLWREECIRRAEILIPEIANSCRRHSLSLLYPVIHSLLCSIQLQQNILAMPSVLALFENPWASNDAKLYSVSQLLKTRMGP